MSTRDVIDTQDWQGASIDTIGAGGFGVLGSEIAATGANGPGYAYNDLQLPADAGKEICGRITVWPLTGTLYAYEDTSFTYSRVGDGAASFQYQLYVDGVTVGTPQTVALNVGSGTAPAATITGTATITAGTASGTGPGIAPPATLSGTAQVIPGIATGNGPQPSTAPGAEMTGTATIIAGSAFQAVPGIRPDVVLTTIMNNNPTYSQAHISSASTYLTASF